MLGGSIDQGTRIVRVTEAALEEARASQVPKPTEVSLYLGILSVVVVGPSGELAAEALDLGFGRIMRLWRVEHVLTVAVQSLDGDVLGRSDAEQFADALRHLCLVLDFDDNVPIAEEVDGTELDVSPGEDVRRASEVQVHGYYLARGSHIRQVRV